jgi:ribosomal protein S18 acetylase RimI-like enzyme
VPTHPPEPSSNPLASEQGAFPVVRLPFDLYESAAARLVSAEAGDPVQAGRRFVQAAPAHGIDLSLMWGTVEKNRREETFVRQVCLAVRGTGKTAVLFISGPTPRGPARAEEAEDRRERVACVAEACAALAREKPGLVRVVQSLPEPGEQWAIEALEAAGFQRVGDLAYLRRPLTRKRPTPVQTPPWPAGVVVRPVRSVSRGDPDRALLAEALDRSYEATLDCPGLCGLRETDDVIDSHLSTGQFDPALWWLVLKDGRGSGCVLFSPCPEQSTVELVYLGLSRELRGQGLARRLLDYGLSRLGGPARLSVTCAVDRQNAPAIALYQRAGFGEFSGRIAYVRAIP